jgi:radical SAM protein with 4Fe4S-binding SPASM domain
MLNENNKHSWCVNPYISIVLEPNGKMVPCCKNSNINYKTDNGSDTIDKESIKNFWYSESRVKFLNDLEKGIRHKSCSSCWQEEDSGKTSYRQRCNMWWEGLAKDVNQSPSVLYIASGNTCNLKCRICDIDRSSKFLEEEKNISLIGNLRVRFNKDIKTGKQSYKDDNDYFWADILEFLPNIEYITFSGGEPLFVKNNQKLIEILVEKGYSKNISISYCTNGTIYLEKTMRLLKDFKSVNINFSIDGINDRFRYLRHPGNFREWEQITERIKLENPKWLLFSIISISTFNIWYLAETYEYCMDRGLHPNLNLVYGMRGIDSIPDELKNKIISNLLQHKSKYDEWGKDRDSIISFLKTSKYNLMKWKLFWRECKQRDTYRNEKFEDVFPEYFTELKRYL